MESPCSICGYGIKTVNDHIENSVVCQIRRGYQAERVKVLERSIQIMRYYQGDVMFETIDQAKVTGKPITDRGRVILVEGEASGHNHTIVLTEADEAWHDDENGVVFLRLAREAAAEHVLGVSSTPTADHAPVLLPPGTYRVGRQYEYVEEEIYRVAD